MSVDLYLDSFRSWLDARTPYGLVGYANDCTYCPAVNWLQRGLGLQEVIVDRDNISYLDPLTHNLVSIDTPGWLSRFIELIDAEPLDDSHTPVNREEALEALNVVEGVY